MIENFSFEKTGIEGLKLIRPFVASDERGFFMKTFEQEIFRENGIELGNAEDMTSCSHKGVLRGLHFQRKHSQDKLIRVLCGEVWDVAVDLRAGSPTFGEWEGFYLSGENKLSVYIPRGFAHGYLALTDNVIFSYRCGTGYYPEYDTGIRWNDGDLNVAWPLERAGKVILSEKDSKLQGFNEFKEKYAGI